jgi:mRNA-degrading endonuclease toxin of MazEF toxin-antitoxin module
MITTLTEVSRYYLLAWSIDPDKLQHDSDLLVDQVRAIDNTRIVHGPLTRLAPALMAKIEEAISPVLDIGGSFDSR